jgi:hypothetical protein
MCGSTLRAETVSVFNNVGIQFGGDPNWNSQAGTTRLDNGRIVERVLQLPAIPESARATTQLNIWASGDAWDRAGSIQLVNASGTIELHKFITGFGGTTSHRQNITNLIPFLRQGPTTVRAFIDTWVKEAWKIDFSLTIDPRPQSIPAPTWNRYVFNDQDWRAGKFANNKRSISVAIPNDLDEVYLSYLASGHASDGSGGDEFTPRRHHIWIDGVEVFNQIPWRTDGRNFRSVNPNSGRWGDVWSSDLERSGWIPGDDVDPYVIDVSQYLTPGRHTIEYQIEGIEPDDGDGYGYWRTSSYITGYKALNPLGDFDGDGDVDGRDLLVWQRGGSPNPLSVTDLSNWQTNFGVAGFQASLSALPEPAAITLWLFTSLVLFVARNRKSAYRD